MKREIKLFLTVFGYLFLFVTCPVWALPYGFFKGYQEIREISKRGDL